MKNMLVSILSLIVGSLIAGSLIGIFILPKIPMFQEFVVKKRYEKEGVTSVIYNEKLKIVLEVRERYSPNLSVVNTRLTDESGNDKSYLGSNEIGIIECTVENKGGPAKNVRVNWKEHFTLEEHQLKISRPTKTISEISQGGSEVFKITVETKERMDSGLITITFEPFYIQNGQEVSSDSEPYTFKFPIRP